MIYAKRTSNIYLVICAFFARDLVIYVQTRSKLTSLHGGLVASSEFTDFVVN
jgi:hypothetical protein